jgi:hypothetical protein
MCEGVELWSHPLYEGELLVDIHGALQPKELPPWRRLGGPQKRSGRGGAKKGGQNAPPRDRFV